MSFIDTLWSSLLVLLLVVIWIPLMGIGGTQRQRELTHPVSLPFFLLSHYFSARSRSVHLNLPTFDYLEIRSLRIKNRKEEIKKVVKWAR